MTEKNLLSLSAETAAEILKFRDDRKWKPFHNPKDLAISISLEAAELLEVFQWSAGDLDVDGKRKEMAEELADILIYAVMFANITGLDIDEIVREKLKKNNKRYPVALAKGLKDKYTVLKQRARLKDAIDRSKAD